MKYKRNLLSLLFFLILVMILSMTVSAAETEEEETEADLPPYQVVSEDGAKYLIETETQKKVTGKKGLTEFPEDSGNFYWFKNKKGQILTKKWIKTKKGVYRANKDGTIASGLTDVGKHTYYFKKSTHLRIEKKWKKVDGVYYWFGKKGRRQQGVVKIKGYVYYLDPEEDGARTVGWKSVSGKKYYFNKKGRMQKGLVTIDGNKYYFSQKGVRKTGLRKINGQRYFFNKKNGKMTTGWVTYKNKTYYFSAKGSAVTGWFVQKKKKYFFNESGVMQKGWVTMDGKKFYFDPSTGVMATGKQTIDGKTYDFGTKGYIVMQVTGTFSIRVNQSTNVVTIYRGSTPVKAMLCSVGLNNATPTGTFSLGTKRHWHALYGNVWGQYTSVITGNILFHSVYYLKYKNNNSLATAEYYKLGSAASHGCVRLCCADAYYIYMNCPVGTKVSIGYYGNTDPLPRPKLTPLTGSFDPTDPNPND